MPMTRSSGSISSGPSPEEFQKQMTDFMRQHFPNIPFLRSQPGAAANAPSSGTGSSNAGTNPGDFHFDKTPKEVKGYLDRFVIKQDEAKKVLSVAMCDHYHHVRLAFEGKEQPNYTN